MTKPHEIAIALNTDHQVADEMEAVNNRLRARIVELAAMVDMMKDVNAAQAAEIITLTAEVERWGDLARRHDRRNFELEKEIITLTKENADLTTLSRTLSERNRWHVHDIDMLRVEVERLTAADNRRTQLVVDATLRRL